MINELVSHAKVGGSSPARNGPAVGMEMDRPSCVDIDQSFSVLAWVKENMGSISMWLSDVTYKVSKVFYVCETLSADLCRPLSYVF